MLLIGFGYKARQGKNSAAIAVINAASLDTNVRQYAYADALKAEVTQAIRQAGSLEELVKRGCVYEDSGVCGCGESMDRHSDPFLAGHAPTEIPRVIELPAWVTAESGKPRTLLQWWGTDYRRAQDPNYWVTQLTDTLKREQPDVALITDVRFPNEVDAIHALGGYAVKVTRTTAPDVKVHAHASENVLDGFNGWDFTIAADNLTELRKQAVAIYRQLEKKQNVKATA
jgi:hypothetical protein